MRDAARDYIRQRFSGKAKSDVGDHDLLALMIKNPDVFRNEDEVIDELVFLLAAGPAVVHKTTYNALAHLVADSAMMDRARAEFVSLLEGSSDSGDFD